MTALLTKDTKHTYVAGSPGTPGFPGQPGIPPRTVTSQVQVCGPVPNAPSLPPGYSWSYKPVEGSVKAGAPSVVKVITGPGGQTGGFGVAIKGGGSTYTCTYKYVTTTIPGQPYIPPRNPVPATPGQTINDYNLGWNAGARSIATFTGDGYIEFKVQSVVQGLFVGLNNNDRGYGYAEMAHAWSLDNNKLARVYEDGAQVAGSWGFVLGDTFRIERRRGVVRYLLNDDEMYVSALPSSGTVFMDVSMYSGGEALFGPAISGMYEVATAFPPLAGMGGDHAVAISAAAFLPLTGTSRQAVRSNTSLRPLTGFAADHAIGQSAAAFAPLTIEAYGGALTFSYALSAASFAFIMGGGYGRTGSNGRADLSFLPLVNGPSSDRPYGDARGVMLPLLGGGTAYEGNGNAYMYEQMFAIDTWLGTHALVVVMNSHGDVVTTFAVNLEELVAMHSDVTVDFDLVLDATLSAIMHTLVLAGFDIPLFGTSQALSAWVVNADSKGSTRYEDYPFNSMTRMPDGRYYGMKSDGLYLLEGDDDADQPVQAMLSFGKRSFFTTRLKRMPNAYLGVSSDGTMYLKVIANGQHYLYPFRDDDQNLMVQRCDVGKGLKASYFELELYNSEGCDFTIDTIEFRAAVLRRRI